MNINKNNFFEKPDDFRNWNKLIDYCDAINDLTEYEKERAKRAFTFLRHEFGDNFLNEAFDNKHPFCNYIVNLAPWTRKWIVWFADALKELKKHENYSKLLTRILEPDKFDEALSILEVAYKLSKVGFSIAIDPQINVSGKEKIPDLKIIDTDTGEELCVEISMLRESRIVRDAVRTMRKITEPLWFSVPFIQYCGRIYKTLSKRHLDHIYEKVKEMVERAIREDSFQELIIEDTLELGIAPEKDRIILEKWAAEKGFKVGEFTGPAFNVNELLRTKRKIEKEQKQLPKNYPNILVIQNNNLFFHIRDIRKLISELEEEIYEYPHILIGIISGRHIGTGEGDLLMKNNHVYIKKVRNYMVVEQHIILLNQFCDHKVFPRIITKIYTAFRNY